MAAATTGAALYAAAVAVGSLRRPMFEDQAVLAYMGYLVTHGWVPYRDFFDMNTAGAHLASAAVGWVSGFTEGGARAVDLAWLALLLWLTRALLRPLDRAAARAAVALTAAIYLSGGLSWALEREALLLPFVAAACLIECRTANRPPPRTGSPFLAAVVAGVLIGVAVTIKPQAWIFAVPLAAHAWWRTRRWLAPIGLAGGTLVAPAAVLMWLGRHQALQPFTEMAVNYWPLYNALSGDRPHLVLSAADLAWTRVVGAVTFGLHPALPLAGAALLGGRLTLGDESSSQARRSFTWLCAGMTVAAWIAVIPAAKFWAYHWWPFCYFAVLLGAQACANGVGDRHRHAALAAVVLLFAGISWSNVGPWARPPRFAFANVERIAAFLRDRAVPGDTAVPLDWMEGALHAMLRARLLPGTPFVYDFHFSHHVSTPYIQSLRTRFLEALDHDQPRFVIRIHRPDRFSGPDTAADFPALEARLASRYRVALADPAFEVLERSTPSTDAAHRLHP